MPIADRVSVSKAFAEDHDRLFALLQEVVDLAPDESSGVARRQIDRFCEDLRRHMAVEDEIIFPQFEEKTGLRTEGPTALLRREHQQIEARLTSIQTTLQNVETVGEALEQLRALKALLEDHRRREEEVLYPTCDRLLDDDQCRKAVQALCPSECSLHKTTFGEST